MQSRVTLKVSLKMDPPPLIDVSLGPLESLRSFFFFFTYRNCKKWKGQSHIFKLKENIFYQHFRADTKTNKTMTNIISCGDDEVDPGDTACAQYLVLIGR